MTKVIKPPHNGVNAVISIANKPLGGQKNASLSRSTKAIDITNQINGQWKRQISGVRAWSLTCSGMYIKDDEAFSALEQAFREGQPVDVKLSDGDKTYQGSAIIVNFPLSAIYSDTYTYNIVFGGTGELHDSSEDTE